MSGEDGEKYLNLINKKQLAWMKMPANGGAVRARGRSDL